jgi:hypothetical protein
VPLEELEREWKDQIEAQLCSAPRKYLSHKPTVPFIDLISGQNKNIADHVITGVLEKKAILRKANLRRARAMGRNGRNKTASEALTAVAEIKSCDEIITSLGETIEEQISVLGFTETPKGSLRKFKGDAFLRLRMNALSLRDRIVQNLIARKFEMEKLERLVNCGNRMRKSCS